VIFQKALLIFTSFYVVLLVLEKLKRMDAGQHRLGKLEEETLHHLTKERGTDGHEQNTQMTYS
jgi:hypothetical protein